MTPQPQRQASRVRRTEEKKTRVLLFLLLLSFMASIKEMENHRVSPEKLARPAGLEPATF
jgi:hypothetical protein